MPEQNESKSQTTYKINEAVAHREIEGQILFLLPDHYELYTLNATGKAVWLDLVAEKSLAQTAEELAARFHIPLEQAQQDIAVLLEDLVAKNIISRL